MTPTSRYRRLKAVPYVTNFAFLAVNDNARNLRYHSDPSPKDSAGKGAARATGVVRGNQSF
jgi:hypothetical protein